MPSLVAPLAPANRGSPPLPNEVLAEVLAYLPDRDVLTLRRVSRRVRSHVDDPSTWHPRIARNGWVAPCPQSPWRDADMLRHYRVQAQFYDRPPGMLTTRGLLDSSDAEEIREAASEFPSTLPELRLTMFPSRTGWDVVHAEWPHVRQLKIREFSPGKSWAPGVASVRFLETLSIERADRMDRKELAALAGSALGLTSLEISSLRHTDVAPLAALQRLTALALLDTRLNVIPADFAHLTQLTSLRLDCGPDQVFSAALLASIPDVCPGLRYLHLSDSSIANDGHLIPLAALDLLSLTLSRTTTTTLPADLCKPGLLRLEVQGNEGFRLPAEAVNLQGLEEINLASTLLDQFPPQLTALAVLAKINVSCNRGLRFDAPMRKMTGLREITALNCGLGTLPPTLLDIESLRRLSLRRNSLSGLPMGFQRLKRLTHLDLAGNPQWKAMPRALRHMDRMTWLSLPRMTNKALPRFAVQFPRLRYLSVEGRQELFGEVPSLRDPPLNERAFYEALRGCTTLRWVACDDMRHKMPLPAGVRPYFQNNNNFTMSYDRNN